MSMETNLDSLCSDEFDGLLFVRYMWWLALETFFTYRNKMAQDYLSYFEFKDMNTALSAP